MIIELEPEDCVFETVLVPGTWVVPTPLERARRLTVRVGTRIFTNQMLIEQFTPFEPSDLLLQEIDKELVREVESSLFGVLARSEPDVDTYAAKYAYRFTFGSTHPRETPTPCDLAIIELDRIDRLEEREL